jgi:DNA-binding transcriptional MerR regulator
MDLCPEPRLVKVGELALETGKSIRTLHYYEELGLLRPVRRTEGGFRLYDASAVQRIRIIERLQTLSVPLARIKELAGAWNGGAAGRAVAAKVRTILEAELGETRRRLTDLKTIEGELERALAFLSECGVCDETPHRDQCATCDKGAHRGGPLPELIDAFLP